MNNNEYLRSLELFLKKIDKVKDTANGNMSEVVDDFCDTMRIGMVDVRFLEKHNPLTKDRKNEIVFYDMGYADPDDFVEFVGVTPDRNSAIYRAHIISGATTWTPDEREKISLFLRLLFVYNGRTRLGYVVERLLYYDMDLEICNLKHFMRHTGRICAQRRAAEFASIYLNLKRFTLINQQIGRDRGTLVMKTFAHRIMELFGEDELIGRIGGDNFIILTLKKNLDRIVDMLRGTPVVYDHGTGAKILVSAKAGVYPIEPGPCTPEIIMDKTIVALNIAKSGTADDIVFYNEELLRRRDHQMAVAARFPRALAMEEFRVYYQPKVALGGCVMIGAEALSRWLTDDGIVPPGDFIPILEKNLDICRLDLYVLEHVCRDLRRWLDEGRRVVPVSVNLSRRHLGDPELISHILTPIDKHHIPHELIEIELTETTTDVELKELRDLLFALKNAGIAASVDDFGAGYSSMTLIKDLPWDVLKIDRGILPASISDSTGSKKSMFRHVVEMAQEMGMECISEGVETAEQIEVLREAGCPTAQGFYFDKPLPVEEFEYRLENYIYDRK
ncbi:MAG: EAL domain-containing protein [Ruminococcus sp.]|nr:EAL domain-containing protein [Ruminococcus sp.]